jgi:hypothetical protein
MTKLEFKQKYFTNNFYWVDVSNYKELQNIGIEFGCLNPSGKKSLINWHDGFQNLGFRTCDNRPTKFQKECFLLHNEKATSYEEMINDYKKLKL